MKKRNRTLIVISFILIISLLSGCLPSVEEAQRNTVEMLEEQMKEREQGNEEALAEQEELSESSLRVYMIGYQASSAEESFYQTRFLLGEFTSQAQVWGPESHIFYAGLQAFQEEYPEVELVVEYGAPSGIFARLEEDRQAGTLPDVIVASYSSQEYNLNSYIEEGYFEDLSSFFQQDGLYENQQYVNKVLEAGRVDGKQLIFPLTFNMNLFFTSEAMLDDQHFSVDAGLSHYEIMELLTSAFLNRESTLLAYNNTQASTFIYNLFDLSSGEDPFQPSQEYFERITRLYEAYLMSDFQMSRAELKEFVAAQQLKALDYNFSNAWQCHREYVGLATEAFPLLREQAALIGEGGISNGMLQSFAAEAYYYNSRFADKGETLRCIPIPLKDNPGAYAAPVSTFGAVLAGSDQSEMGYTLLRYLADTPHSMFLDLSVNRQCIEEVLEQYTQTSFDYSPALGNFPPEAEPEPGTWSSNRYLIQPMSEETAQTLRDMIDHIEASQLPNGKARRHVREQAERYIYGDLDSIEQAYAAIDTGIE